jgi:formate hydrogenlyase subunit 3/multisubunit Na+/H+ antiporter MnhD subunit
MRRRKQVLSFCCVLLCLAAIYVPLLIGGYALAIVMEALWNRQQNVAQSALLVAVICGIAWLLPISAWYLAQRLRNGEEA